jgi:hypothetical protein
MASESDPREDINDFLVFLAKHATPERFYPFPDKFRKHALVPDEKASRHLGVEFAPYSQEEYADMYAVLKTIPDELSTDVIKKLSERQLDLVNYLVNPRVRMSNHGKTLHPSITEYEFRYGAFQERLRNAKYKQRWYLYHGSPLGNWHSIIRNGIKNMSNTKLMSAGAAHGPGVYLTNDLQTAAGYGQGGSKTCIAVVEILEDPEKYKKSPHVYVIPNDSILIPRYLYQIKKVPRGDGKEALAFYKRVAEHNITPPSVNKVQKRIIFDFVTVAPYAQIVLDRAPNYDVLIDPVEGHHSPSVLVEINLDCYPFQQPIIRLKYKLTPELTDASIDASGVYKYPCFSTWGPMNNLDDILSPLRQILIGHDMTTVEYPPIIYDV